MKIVITGTASGIGHELVKKLSHHNVIALTRRDLDLSNINSVINYNMETCDMLINCAATDVGGKINFVNHDANYIAEILNTNLLSPMLLSQQALAKNCSCKIVNITSTNNNRYHANNLAYSLSKQALANFGAMLKVDYPDIQYLEIKLGLTKTNFNKNRYRYDQDRFVDVYEHHHLTVDQATSKILDVLFDPLINMIEISP